MERTWISLPVNAKTTGEWKAPLVLGTDYFGFGTSIEHVATETASAPNPDCEFNVWRIVVPDQGFEIVPYMTEEATGDIVGDIYNVLKTFDHKRPILVPSVPLRTAALFRTFVCTGDYVTDYRTSFLICVRKTAGYNFASKMSILWVKRG